MTVIVIINHIGEGSSTGIRCANQSEGTLITFLVQFRSSALYPQTISLAHLLGSNSTGESSYIRPQITVVSVYFIHFITADTDIHMFLFQFIHPDFAGFLACQVGHDTTPYGV